MGGIYEGVDRRAVLRRSFMAKLRIISLAAFEKRHTNTAKEWGTDLVHEVRELSG